MLHPTLISSGHDVVWGMDFVSPEEMIFSQRNGHIFLLNLKTQKTREVIGTPDVIARGQGGMLDIKIYNDPQKRTWLYMTYAAPVTPQTQTTKLARAILSENTLTQFEQLFMALPAQTTTHHYGSRIAFDQKGHLFFTVGERGQRDLAQDLTTHMGKIIRLHLDGSIPNDNPFYKHASAQKEIWSYGHRNPQGIFFDLTTEKLWAQEHGPRGGDEINLIKPGANYGWPKITYGREYHGPKIGTTHQEGLEQPFYYFVPSIAPSSLYLYRGEKYPMLNNTFLSGALALHHINAVHIESKQESRFLEKQHHRVRHIIEGPDLHLYFSTDGGEIYRLDP
ncbi:MAG: PQQ-dependent sugar dehydrogenase [Deltaproteobacteria bacterium]|nr:PQQ-dependent sugar dehydrogenase [Deltaproteobacteria bacterium]